MAGLPPRGCDRPSEIKPHCCDAATAAQPRAKAHRAHDLSSTP